MFFGEHLGCGSPLEWRRSTSCEDPIFIAWSRALKRDRRSGAKGCWGCERNGGAAGALPFLFFCAQLQHVGNVKPISPEDEAQAVTRVKSEQASKATMRMATLRPFGEGSTSGDEIEMRTCSIRRGSGHGAPERWFG